MFSRTVMTALLVALFLASAVRHAEAQQPVSAGLQASSSSGWTFNVAPYVWTATIDASSKFNLPSVRGGTVTSDASVGFGSILSHLNFGLMVSADAQYDRFSVLTDFMYLNVSGAASRFRSVNFPNASGVPVPATVQSHVGLNLNAKIWTLAGGYTLVKGDWGNFDMIAGFRFLGIPATVDYSLAATITGPSGSDTFGGSGSLSATANLWNGIGGFRGRVRLADTGLFIPYYFDAGTGASQFTWQISSGLGYHARWADVSLTWRYLSFEQKSAARLQNLSINGPLLMANFSF